MSISIFYGVVIIGTVSGWTLDVDKMQKILYVSNVVYVGRYKELLFTESFYADYDGPICAILQQELNQCGIRYVSAGIFDNIKLTDELLQSKECEIICNIYNRLDKESRSSLKKLTTIKNGAWDKAYTTQQTTFRLISIEDMAQEYKLFYQ